MSLSDDIIRPPPGMTCACGECDLSYVRTTKIKQALKEVKHRLNIKLFDICDLTEIFGEELLNEM